MNFSKKNHDFLKGNKTIMCKNIKKITLAALLIMSFGVFAQKEIKEGVMTMKVTMSSDNEQMTAQFAMLGEIVSTTYFKGNKTRSEQKHAMIGNNTSIVDNDTKDMLALLDNPMLGKKYIKQKLEKSEDELKDVTVTANGETKIVLGYDCKGYDIVTKQSGQELKMKMFVTNKILAQEQYSAGLGGKLEGFPLYMEITINQPGMGTLTTKLETTEIKAESVDDSKFDMTIPDGFEEMAIPKQ